MKITFLLFSLLFISFPSLTSQNALKSSHLEFGITPLICGMSNGTIGGKNKPGFGYQIEAGFFQQINQKMNVETAIHLQKVNLKQRSNNLQWPSDVDNGQWVPGRSYEQFEAEYLAAGLSIGLNLKLIDKVNTLSIHWSGIVRKVFDYNDTLVINESGHFTQFHDSNLENEVNKYQFLLGLGLRYDVGMHQKKIFSIGPSFEYSITDLLRTSQPNLLWEYERGHPFFLGLRIAYKWKS